MDKYMVILEKKMFRELEVPDPPSAQTSAIPTSATAAFGRNYELKALIDTGTGVRAGFFDKSAKENFYISEGGTYKGMQLVSVNYDNEEAVLQLGGEPCSFSMRPDKSKPASTSPAPQAVASLPALSKPPGGMPPGLPFKPDPGKAEYRGKTIEQFLRDHPEAARQANSPIRVSAPNFKAFGKGMSIDQFLKEHPEAMKQFPSPIQPLPTGGEAISKGEAIERMMRQAQQRSGSLPASPEAMPGSPSAPAMPAPATPAPAPVQEAVPEPEAIAPMPLDPAPDPGPEAAPVYPVEETEAQ